MVLLFSSIATILEKGVSYSKQELIRRYRSWQAADIFVLKLIYLLPFACIGKDEEGSPFYY